MPLQSLSGSFSSAIISFKLPPAFSGSSFFFSAYSPMFLICCVVKSLAASFWSSGSKRESFNASFLEIFLSAFLMISFASCVRFFAVCICRSTVRGTTPSFSAVSCANDFVSKNDILSLLEVWPLRIPRFVSGCRVSYISFRRRSISPYSNVDMSLLTMFSSISASSAASPSRLLTVQSTSVHPSLFTASRRWRPAIRKLSRSMVRGFKSPISRILSASSPTWQVSRLRRPSFT